MKIAPNFTSTEWLSLDLESGNEEHWQTAIDALQGRLYSRYIEPVDLLLESERGLEEKDRRYGFTILAIDLLLMETLQAFKEGIPDTIGQSKKVFKRYLEQSPSFSKFFTTEDQREAFYVSFRCGILHQAEIQGPAIVWSLGDLYERADGLEVLNRTEVHSAVKGDLDDYLTDLRDPTHTDERSRFKYKMDSIANRAPAV